MIAPCWGVGLVSLSVSMNRWLRQRLTQIVPCRREETGFGQLFFFQLVHRFDQCVLDFLRSVKSINVPT